MAPTMYRCGLLLLTLTVALGSPPRGTDLNQDSQLAPNDYCVLNSPTVVCYLRCAQQQLKPFCEEEHGLCVCVPVDQGDETNDSTDASTQTLSSGSETNATDTEDDGRLHMIFYIFDLSSWFGDDNDTETINATSITPVRVEDFGDESESETLRGWAASHLLAVIIIGLLCVLIIVELFTCLRKQKSRRKEANIFTNSLGVTNKS